MKSKKLIPTMIISGLLLIGCSNYLFPGHDTFSGTLEMDEHSVGARVSGRISTLDAEEGMPVKAGQLIATLERFEQAKRDFERVKKLYEVGGASHQDLEQAQLNLEDQQIVSPVDGVILTRVRQLGEITAPGSVVAVIGNDQKYWVRIFIPEGQISSVHMGQAATVKLDGVEKKLKAHVTYISTQAEFTPRNVQTAEERVTQTFAVKVTFDEPDELLHAGISGEVKLEKK